MKHIFKKRPKGSNHEPPPPTRSNDTSSSTDTVSPSRVSDHPTATSNRNSGHDPTASSPSTPITGPSNSSNTPELSSVNLQDYLSSEEEYQVQLALALSVSGSGSPNVPEKHQLGDRKLPREGDSVRKRNASVADLMSRQYWDYGVLDFEEKVVDGFYIVHGLATNPMTEGKMPSLADLETNDGNSAFEVVLVDRRIDPSLEELLQIAQCVKLGIADGDISILVQRLAELVTEHMGGSVKDANIMLTRWTERSSELSTSLHTSASPIGSLKIGLSRHRALLFKVLADNVGLPCRLVKGSHYTGIEDDAINVVKLDSGSEFLVDLMGAPGMLIPADILNGKVTSFSSAALEASKLPIHEINHGSAVSVPVLEPLGESEGNSHRFGVKRSSPERKPCSQMAESSPSLTVRNDTGVRSSQTAKVASTLQSDDVPLLGRDKPVHKGSHGQTAAIDGSRMNFNIVPYAQSSKEDSTNLFADLNPFYIKGTGQSSAQNNPAWCKVDDMQRSKNSSYRPPAPLMWKNRHACNEVPSKKESDFVERVQRSSRGANDCNLGTLNTATSTLNRIANFDNQKLKANSSSEYHDESSSLVAGNSLLPSIERQVDRLSLVKTSENNHKDDVLMVNDRAHSAQGNGTSVSRIYDYRKSSPDMTDLKQKGLQSPTSSSIYSSSFVDDQMIDDVGECEIRWEDLQIGDRIGLGSYGEVYHADWNGTEVAVKKFLDQDFSGDALAEFRREVRIMRRFRHPNIVLFMGAVTRPPHLSIVSEFLPRGSLHRIIHRRNCPIDENRRIRMALDVAKGMNCLHTSVPTIVHRDLKSPNLLVDNNWTVKVCDFGLSRLKHNTFLSSKSTAGTPEWMAPEVLRNEPSNEKCDVFSFGVILWQLATLKLPWAGMNPMQVVGAVGFQNRRLAIPEEVDPVVARIIRECWQTDPNLRPSFAQLAVALKSLQRLVIPSHVEQQSSYYAQEISMNSTP